MTTHSTPTSDTAVEHGQEPHVHITRPLMLLGVYGALVFLTIITVGVTHFDLGKYNVLIALLIAVVKAALVVLFFMHLLWDSPFNGIILIIAILFVALFMGITTMDSANYAPNLVPPLTSSTNQRH